MVFQAVFMESGSNDQDKDTFSIQVNPFFLKLYNGYEFIDRLQFRK